MIRLYIKLHWIYLTCLPEIYTYSLMSKIWHRPTKLINTWVFGIKQIGLLSGLRGELHFWSYIWTMRGTAFLELWVIVLQQQKTEQSVRVRTSHAKSEMRSGFGETPLTAVTSVWVSLLRRNGDSSRDLWLKPLAINHTLNHPHLSLPLENVTITQRLTCHSWRKDKYQSRPILFFVFLNSLV